MKKQIVSFTIALSVLASALIPSAAFASSKGRKNTTIVLGALAANQLLTGKTTNGILLGAGTAYAYKRYRDARKSEKRRARTATIYRTRRYRRARR